MSISLKEFFRLLPRVLQNTRYTISKNVIHISYLKGIIKIRTGEQLARKIASLRLPMLKVEFDFYNIEQDDVYIFLTNFNRVYQRGGG